MIGLGRGMNSVRESIEWSYKDAKSIWKYMDYKILLQLKKQPLAKILFVCFLLKNAHVAMYGCQTSQAFGCMPPSFERWIAQGPQGRPLPRDSLFHPDFVLGVYGGYDTDDDDDDD